ncbi:MAG: radical SAM protein [Bacillota bacterium]
MFPLQYEGDVYRPPSEANSLILQATIGCSHNRCTFCVSYKQKKFRERSLDEIITDIALTSKLLPQTRRVFLADGNALVISYEKLLKILQELDRAFPFLERVSVYGNAQDLLQKSITELRELGNNKLGMIYLGLESGSADVLQAVKKGVNPEQIFEGTARAKAAGIPLSITVVNGLAGIEGSEEHAISTARLLNRIDPEYLGLLSLMAVPGTTIHRQIKAGLLTPLTPWDLLQEIKMIVEGLELTNCVFRANHASNYLPLKAVLPRDKDALLDELDRIIKQKAHGSLRSEYLRGL